MEDIESLCALHGNLLKDCTYIDGVELEKLNNFK